MSTLVFVVRRYGLSLLLAGVCFLIAGLDGLLGAEVCPWGLYLLPIAFAGWASGVRMSVGLSVLSIVLVVAVGLRLGHPFSSSFYFLVSASNRLASFLMVAYLSAQHGRVEELKSVVRSYEEIL